MMDSASTKPDYTSRRQFLLAAGAAGIGAGMARFNFRSPGNTIKVGILHSLSGTMAISEAPLRDAALLAMEEVNRQGGLLGRQVEAVVEDAASDPDRFQVLAEKLLAQDQVCSIFGCWTSISRKKVLPVLQQHDGLLWYPLQYEGNECSRNVIYTGSTPNQQILPAVDWLHGRGSRRFYLLGSDYIYPRTANRIVERHLEEIRGVVAGKEYVPLGEQDFQATIKRIRAARPDVVFSTINGDSNRGFYKAFRKAGITAKDLPVMATTLAEAEVRRIGALLTEGHLSTWAYFQSVDTLDNNAFVKKFKDRYGDRRVTDDPIEAAYFQVHIWAEAVRKAQSIDVDAVRETVLGIKYNAPEGPVRIDPQNRHTWKMFRIGEVGENGQFNVLHSSGDPVDPAPWDQTLNSGLACDWKTGHTR
jgi:urea transport system substrate-binding protein